MLTGRFDQRARAKRRLGAELGFVAPRDAPMRVCLGYPSPYFLAMSSLGFQSLYRELMSRTDTLVDRAFVPDTPEDSRSLGASGEPLRAYATGIAVRDFPIVGLSVAYELELAGVFTFLDLAGIPVLSRDRGAPDPLVVMGGPLTFSNPDPLCPFADAIVMGEGEEIIHAVVDVIAQTTGREAQIAALARIQGVWVPSRSLVRPAVAKADDAQLPAYAPIVTDETELSGMFLIEAERGCHRGCTYCVMRRGTNGGMRIVAPDRILGLIPEAAKRVGLVGAAVSDHPKICDILRAIVDGGRTVSLSSLRADRLNAEFVGLLARGGHRTLTVASDAASERLRDQIMRKIHERHLLKAAELARASKMKRLKTYMMVGLPGETADDIDELVRFTRELAKILPVAMGIAPFVAKRNTPLDGTPFESIESLEHKLGQIRRGLAGVAEVRPTSARWAWVEYQLAQGGPAAGLAALEAHRAGGSFAAHRRAFVQITYFASDRRESQWLERANEMGSPTGTEGAPHLSTHKVDAMPLPLAQAIA